ncbi:polyprenol phosphomannose-dependent alpha 1,6 mannosyltransferase MptB [Streptomyces sp. NPDC096030]|uniref:polyprenol phosphomannose-dependent alpha 1,6 mannosyltransferase MptB n=1 Tax=Streptomyces sp. NPDC096030 TaxID=3155423 RepID=UPI00332A3BB3
MLGSGLLSAGGWSAGALPLGVRDGVWAQRGPALTVLGAATAYAGLVLLVAAWWWLGQLLRDGSAVGPGGLRSVLWSWVVPLLPGPLLFSTDAYSYLAQGVLAERGWDVYRLGPEVLGGPLADSVPEMWRDTPAPYGPLAIVAMRAVVALTGEHHVVAGALGMRLLALIGLGLIVWAVRRIAAGTGTSEDGALWAAVLNPLVLVHLVGGAHNEALMLGLMTAGLLAFRRGRWVLGTAVLVSAALVKVPAALALCCAAAVSVASAASAAGRPDGWPGRLRAAGIALVAAASLLLAVGASGLGWGWLRTLRTPAQVYTALSLSTDAGRLLGLLTDWLGMGTDTGVGAVAVARMAGMLLGLCAVAVCVRRAPRTGAEYATGLALLALVVSAPVVQPWYLLWGTVPLAAVAWQLLERTWVRLATVVLLFMVLPSGWEPSVAYVLAAVIGSSAAVAGLLAWAPPGALCRVRGFAFLRAAARTRRSGSRAGSPPGG